MSEAQTGPALRQSLRETAGMFAAVMRRDFILLRRYPVNTLGGIAATYAFFLLIFFGGRQFGGDQFQESLGGIIVGYFLWTMAVGAYQSLANQVTSEAQWGTLERLYMSPVGFGRVMAMMSVSSILYSFLWGIVILALSLATTGRTLAIDVVSVVPVVTFALMSVLGVGFVFGGAAVRFKRVGNVFNLLQFGFVALMAAPVEQYPALKALPLAQGSYLLREVMAEGRGLADLPATELGVLVAVGVGYFVAGYVVFALATRWSRRAGVMGHY
jgi:ABC-2 type transport system permease protein